jgi:glycosyltransferase involved in cell wall biosynthesis
MTPPACKLSVTVITRNEEAQIGECMESVRWADEIVIVDTGSTDRTLEICSKYTSHVYSRPWEGYAPAKNAAIELATGDWILSLDADESASDGLHAEIATMQHQPMATLAEGYAVPRRNYLWGRWLRYGGLYPDYQIRLFKRGKGHFTARRVHESVAIDGRIESLQHPIAHYSYQGISDVIRRLDGYTELAALDLRDQGQPFRLTPLVMHPLGRFLRNYVLKQGFRDGIPGLIMAVSYAYSVFAREAKLWELTGAKTQEAEHVKAGTPDEDGRGSRMSERV